PAARNTKVAEPANSLRSLFRRVLRSPSHCRVPSQNGRGRDEFRLGSRHRGCSGRSSHSLSFTLLSSWSSGILCTYRVFSALEFRGSSIQSHGTEALLHGLRNWWLGCVDDRVFAVLHARWHAGANAPSISRG